MRSQALFSERTRSWVLPAALCVLAAIPVAAGIARLVGLSGVAPRTAENDRFFADPVPVVVHVLGATAFALLGAFQLWRDGRARFPRWHRLAGRVAVLGGLAASASGIYMAHFYELPPDDGPALYVMRLLFGPAMLTCLLLGAWSARRRAFAAHRVWMLRAYAIGMGAGTQALLHLPWLLLFGKPSVDARAVLMGAGWVVNLLFVELRKG